MLEPRQELAAAELGGVIFTVGGLVGSATANEVYDPFSDSWSAEADFPIADGPLLGGGSRGPALRRGRKQQSRLLVRHGVRSLERGRVRRPSCTEAHLRRWSWTAGSSWPEEAEAGMVGNEVEAYDPLTDGWSPLAPMNCARNHTAGGLIGGKLYVAGGRPGNQTCLEALRSRRGHLDLEGADADGPLRDRGSGGRGLLLCFRRRRQLERSQWDLSRGRSLRSGERRMDAAAAHADRAGTASMRRFWETSSIFRAGRRGRGWAPPQSTRRMCSIRPWRRASRSFPRARARHRGPFPGTEGSLALPVGESLP